MHKPLILHLLKTPMYGYKLKQALEELGYPIGDGTLYPLLHGMERAGLLQTWLRTRNGRARKYYEITFEGIRVWDVAVDEIKTILKKVTA
jgi:DNA-binding PadR family transcriptional regulator